MQLYEYTDICHNTMRINNVYMANQTEDYKQAARFNTMCDEGQPADPPYYREVLFLTGDLSLTGRTAFVMQTSQVTSVQGHQYYPANLYLLYGGLTIKRTYEPNPENPQIITDQQSAFGVGCIDEDPQTGSVYLMQILNTKYFSTNIPIFLREDAAYAVTYCTAESDAVAMEALKHAINYSAYGENTQTWYYGDTIQNTTYNNGDVQGAGTASYRSVKFQSNTIPGFYFRQKDSLELVLKAPNVLISYTNAAPLSVADNVPTSAWSAGMAYSGAYYGNYYKYEGAFHETIANGTYTTNIRLQTNIPIFESEEDLDEALVTGDFSKAINKQDIGDNDYEVEPNFGEREDETTFGGGGFMSPFFTILSGSKSDLHRIAEVLFTDDSSLWDDIKKGLELYGSNPIDYVISIIAYGFDLSRVTTQSTRNDIWFGSYEHHFATAFNEVVNLSAKYIDAGTFKYNPRSFSYKDIEPYTELSAFFPYHGWETLDIKKYYNKTCNVRYYVDVLTGQAVIVTVVDGKICDKFGPCEIGQFLPFTGNNYSQWAQGQVRLLQQGIGGILGGGISGAIQGGGYGAAGGLISGGIGAYGNLFEMKQKGGPKNTMVTKGNFTCGIGHYMPGHVIFRIDRHEMLEPANLQNIYGRPSNASGFVRNFSGFLKAETVKLDTSGMTDAEAARVANLLKSGIYV